jgi:hypothetical protein
MKVASLFDFSSILSKNSAFQKVIGMKNKLKLNTQKGNINFLQFAT